MPKKQSSATLSTLAANILNLIKAGKTPHPIDVKRLAASVLAQDETKGQKKAAKKKA